MIRQPAPAGSGKQDERIVFLGPDKNGVVLEVMAVKTDDSIVIIHAMAIRDRYRHHLQPPRTEDQGDGDA